MKLTVIAVLSLSLILVHIHFSLAVKRIKLSDKINLLKKKILDTKSKIKQPKQKNPQPSGRPGSYPKQGGYHPAGGYPAQGSRYGGDYGAYGGYPGGYMNYNPNNRILSPHYGGSFGYGGYGAGGGSPFSHSVQAMGRYPSDSSRGFGHSAVMAAAGGAMAGMALGYGLGRFPRPHFSFNSPQEEYYYNHYMYRKYGVKSTDTNDYSRDYKYTPPPLTYDHYMDSCMKRTDLLPAENKNPNNKPAATIDAKTTTPTAAPGAGTGSNTTTTNNTAAGNPFTLQPLNESEANLVPPVRKAATDNEDDVDDDTVSIVEIGYPALIRQVKVRRCVELYMAYSEKYLRKPTGGTQGLEINLGGLLAVSMILMLLSVF
ncbi:hypothetical protein EXN66_Car011268 [Channa argus]|uniref:Prion protein, related sequence 3 n=1 Tax=Channa argus TaxID=215402 RepID=A0A6G1PZC3_CHAAH|nr:hypothetical protein EXN66_Car011268 [Channa argus]